MGGERGDIFYYNMKLTYMGYKGAECPQVLGDMLERNCLSR